MKVAFFDLMHWNQEHLENLTRDHEAKFFQHSIQEEGAHNVPDAEVICFFISSKVDRKVLDQMPNLKLVCTMSTGFDHIDLEACEEREITVCNVPYYGENTTAEHAFALLLSISRRIPEAIESTRNGDFSVIGLEGFDLSGKTIGILGAGHIGMHAIKIAKGLDMKVQVFDMEQQPEVAKKWNFKYVDMHTLLATSDVISIHVPYTKETHHLINRENIVNIKKGCILINTSRGAVVDTEALVWALENKIIGAAGLDVLEGEELIGHQARSEQEREILQLNEELLEMRNVIVTPHNAFNTKEALGRIETTTVENINKFAQGTFENIVKR